MAGFVRWSSFRALFGSEQASGLAIIAALALGMATANSPIANWYDIAHHLPVHFGIASFQFREPLIGFVNDGLMVFFFLLVGLELKRELLEGHLAASGAAALPAFAALGGMAAPAAIYSLVNWGDPVAIRGWPIPTATDIVLALGVMSLLGARVPPALTVFLTGVAIFDDIGAVVVIGLFYGEGAHLTALVLAGIAFAGLVALGARRVASPLPYVMGGFALWVMMVAAGLEPALAGALIAATVPMRARGNDEQSPLLHLERRLQSTVALGVVPLFVFLNAGVKIDAAALEQLLTPAPMGVVLGLIVGKPLGIAGAAWLAVRLGLGRLPSGVSWSQMSGAALLGGIGFTMSLYVATLAFADPEAVAAIKLAVLAGSVLAATAGLLVLGLATRGSG